MTAALLRCAWLALTAPLRRSTSTSAPSVRWLGFDQLRPVGEEAL